MSKSEYKAFLKRVKDSLRNPNIPKKTREKMKCPETCWCWFKDEPHDCPIRKKVRK